MLTLVTIPRSLRWTKVSVGIEDMLDVVTGNDATELRFDKEEFETDDIKFHHLTDGQVTEMFEKYKKLSEEAYAAFQLLNHPP